MIIFFRVISLLLISQSAFAQDRQPIGQLRENQVKATIAIGRLNSNGLRSSAVPAKFLYTMQREAIRQGSPLSRRELTQAAYEIRKATEEERQRIAGGTGNAVNDALRDGTGTAAEIIIGALIPAGKVGKIARKLPGVRHIWTKVSSKASKAFNKGIVAGIAKAGGKVTQQAVEGVWSLSGLDKATTDERTELATKHSDDFEYMAKGMPDLVALAQSDDAIYYALKDSGLEGDMGILMRGSLEENLALNPEIDTNLKTEAILKGIARIEVLQDQLNNKLISKEEFNQQLNEAFSAVSEVVNEGNKQLVTTIKELMSEPDEEKRKEVQKYAQGTQAALYLVSMAIAGSDPKAARILNASADAGAKLTMLITDLVMKKLAQSAVMNTVFFVVGVAQIAGDLIGAIIGGPSELEIILDAIKGLSEQIAQTEARLADQMKGISAQITQLLHVMVDSFQGMEQHLRGIDGSLDRVLSQLGQANHSLRQLGFAVHLTASDIKKLEMSLSLADCKKKDEASFVACLAKLRATIELSGDSTAAGEYLRQFTEQDTSEVLRRLGDSNADNYLNLNLLGSLACLLYGDESMGSGACGLFSEKKLSQKPNLVNPAEWRIRTQALITFLNENRELIPLQPKEVRAALDAAFQTGLQTRNALYTLGREDGADSSSAILGALQAYRSAAAVLPESIRTARTTFSEMELGGYDLNKNPETIEPKGHLVKLLTERSRICNDSLTNEQISADPGVPVDLTMGEWAQLLVPKFLVLADQFGSQIGEQGSRLHICIEKFEWTDTYTRAQINSISNTRKNLNDLVDSEKFDEIPYELRVKFRDYHHRFQNWLTESNDIPGRIKNGQRVLHEDNLTFSPLEISELDAAWSYNRSLGILPDEPWRVPIKYIYQFGRPTFTIRMFFAPTSKDVDRQKVVGRFVFKDSAYYQYGVGKVEAKALVPQPAAIQDGIRVGDYPERKLVSADLNRHMHFFDIASGGEYQSKHKLVPSEGDFSHTHANLLAERMRDRLGAQLSDIRRKADLGHEVTAQEVLNAGIVFELDGSPHVQSVKDQLKVLWSSKRREFALNVAAALAGKSDALERELGNQPAFKQLGAIGNQTELHRRLLSAYLSLSFPDSVYESFPLYEFTQFNGLSFGHSYFADLLARIEKTAPEAVNEPGLEKLETLRVKTGQGEEELEVAALVGSAPIHFGSNVDPDLTDVHSEQAFEINLLQNVIEKLMQERTAANHVLNRTESGRGNVEYASVIEETLEEINKERGLHESILGGHSIDAVFFELKAKLMDRYTK